MSARIQSQINAILDACSPSCAVRREFLLRWRTVGLTQAYSSWSTRNDLLNRQYIPQLESLIEQARQEGQELLR
jgi:hypothetical protein